MKMVEEERCVICDVILTAINSDIFDLNLCRDCAKEYERIRRPKKKEVEEK